MATPTSICSTPRGHWDGQLPQVVQRQISSSSISGRPRAACHTILRMLKGRSRFQGQTTSHFPHW
jgi:hypothetical protein